MTKTRNLTIILPTGYEFTLMPNEGTAEEPHGEYGEFSVAEPVEKVPLDSYAYTHGGEAYQEAVEVLHGLHMFHS